MSLKDSGAEELYEALIKELRRNAAPGEQIDPMILPRPLPGHLRPKTRDYGPWKEDICEICGAHVGWGVEFMHLKRCDDHPRISPPLDPPPSS